MNYLKIEILLLIILINQPYALNSLVEGFNNARRVQGKIRDPKKIRLFALPDSKILRVGVCPLAIGKKSSQEYGARRPLTPASLATSKEYALKRTEEITEMHNRPESKDSEIEKMLKNLKFNFGKFQRDETTVPVPKIKIPYSKEEDEF